MPPILSHQANETALRFYLTPVTMAVIKKAKDNKCDKDVAKEKPYVLLLLRVWKSAWSNLQKEN